MAYLWEACENGGSAWGAATDRCESILKYQAPLRQSVKMRCTNHGVVINLGLEAGIISCLHTKHQCKF